MPQGVLTAFDLARVRIQLNQIFAKTPGRSQLDVPHTSANLLLQNHGMAYNKTLSDRATCVGVNARFLRAYNTEVLDSTTPLALDCDLPTGDLVGSESKDYAPNIHLGVKKEVNDNLCDSSLTAARLASIQLDHAMAVLRERINKKAIEAFDANVETTFSVDSTEFNHGIISKMYVDAAQRGINAFRVHSGTNLFQGYFDAGFNNLNDNQRDQLARYNYPTDMTFDIRALDSVLGEKATYVMDLSGLGFFQKATGTAGFTSVDPSRNKFEFQLQDPVLRYKATGIGDNGAVSTALVPVTYKVEYQYLCDETTRDGNGDAVYVHRWMVRFDGGIISAPVGLGGETGILKYVNVAAPATT